MNKRYAALAQRLNENRTKQNEIYQEVLSQVVDPQRATGLLMHLETLAEDRLHVHRELQAESDKQRVSWVAWLFNQ